MKKKILPKIKKSLKGFLTDESGKITKKDALGMSIGTLALSSVGSAGAAIHQSSSPSLPYPAVTDGYRHNNSGGTTQMAVVTSATCNHASGVVNGHYSSIPAVNTTNQIYNLSSHGSHSSHGNHGSGGWC